MIDNLKKYKKYINSYYILTKNNYRMKDKLRIYISTNEKYMRLGSYILTANSINDLNLQIEELFNDYLELKTSIRDVLSKSDNNHVNKNQLKLF